MFFLKLQYYCSSFINSKMACAFWYTSKLPTKGVVRNLFSFLWWWSLGHLATDPTMPRKPHLLWYQLDCKGTRKGWIPFRCYERLFGVIPSSISSCLLRYNCKRLHQVLLVLYIEEYSIREIEQRTNPWYRMINELLSR